MKKVIFDIETDGLLDDVQNVWCLVIRDIEDINNVKIYTQENMIEGLHQLSQAHVIAGHNIIGYDLAVLMKVYGWWPGRGQKIWDTWLMSLVLQYNRKHKHGLAGWGEALGEAKGDFNTKDKITECSQELIDYCVQDTLVNWKVYEKLSNNARALTKRNPMFIKGLEVEMKFAMIEQEIQLGGWNFNKDAAQVLQLAIKLEMEKIEAKIIPKIGIQKVYYGETKQKRFKKDGTLFAQTEKDFAEYQIEQIDELNYRRFLMEEPSLGSLEVVKSWLYSIGWEPDEWNWEKLNGQMVKRGPKLTDSSLLKLPDGEDLIRYYAIRNRLGILNGWLEQVEKKGRLHGRMWTIGTPTFRCRHEIIANLPSVDSVLGKEMRSLFLPDTGKILVGADSSGNQMRGFCHYLGDPEFTREVIEGDVHQRNADILGVSRKLAKPFLYAFLFGASAGKLALTITGKRDAKYGKELMDKFMQSIPGLKKLKTRFEGELSETGMNYGQQFAYITGIDGRRIFVDSPHKALVSVLQSLEGLTCKAAAVYLQEKLLANGIEHQFLLHYHDEMALQVAPEDAERVSKLAVEAFTEAPKWFGVEIMTGAAHIGNTYADIH